MRPIRLHLDTSDYAAMYKALPGTADAGTRDRLIELVECGTIEIGLSFHVVFEFLQKAEPKFRDDRIARARLLTRLCRKNAFPYLTDLTQGHRFSTDGIWVPRIYLEEVEIEAVIQTMMQTIAARPASTPHERKALSKRTYFVEWVRSNPDASGHLINEHWPLLFGRELVTGGDFNQYVLGQMTRSEANEKLRFYITDPEAVYETWFENYGRENPVPELRDKIANAFVEMLSERKRIMDEIAADKKAIKAAISARGEARLGAEDRARFATLARDLESYRSDLTSPDEMSKDPAWVKVVGKEGTQIAAEIFHALLKEKREIKRSDGIDLVHAMYLPHVDLWRGDRAFSGLLIKNKTPFHERVVPTLAELLGRIEAECAKEQIAIPRASDRGYAPGC